MHLLWRGKQISGLQQPQAQEIMWVSGRYFYADGQVEYLRPQGRALYLVEPS